MGKLYHMEKTGEMKEGISVCDNCGCKADVIHSDGTAWCNKHIPNADKVAQTTPAGVNLKSAAEKLVEQHGA